MDTEGTEHFILEHAQNVLKEHKTHYYLRNTFQHY